MNDKPLIPWIILREDGSIYAAHCTCVAGLGEACSHTAAVAFTIFFQKSVDKDVESCTDKLSVWPAPKTVKKIIPQRIRDIYFGQEETSFKGKIVLLFNYQSK